MVSFMRGNNFIAKEYLVIKGTRYKVILGSKLFDDDGREADGLFDPEKKTISIHKNLTLKKAKEVFLHELLHAYFYECNLREGIDTQLEEVIVETAAQGILKHFDVVWRK